MPHPNLPCGELIANLAQNWVGTPYKTNSQSKGYGCDCAGLVIGIYQEIGLGNNWRELGLVRVLERFFTSAENPKIGDILLFQNNQNQDDHIGIFIGNGRFIHAHWSRGVVINSLGRWFLSRLKNSYKFRG